jgi:hypothetical protein
MEDYMDDISYQKFLITRICELNLNVVEGFGQCFERIKKELRSRRIPLWPDFYFGDEWGCVNKRISISIPFYLATPELKALQGDVPSNEDLVKILRHEIGHAVNYAYGLWQRKEWREIFGDFSKKYPRLYLYRVNPWSKSHVRHLHYLGDPHYAQTHPDEDWAETFATWLDPRSHWERRYRNWPNAMEKLSYVDRLMSEIAGKEPPNLKRKHHQPYWMIKDTVSEWWGLDGELLDQELQAYLKYMNELFFRPAKESKKVLAAWKLIQKYARPLTETIHLRIPGSNKHTIRKCLRQWEAICRNESLRYRSEDEEQALIQLTSLLTYHVADGVYHLQT